MELPKNITQIGEADAKCKIYVEDYVVSFLKQLNPLARDKTMAAALYGKRDTEDDKSYLFVYGAGKLDFIQKETRHLSQAQKQEIERIRRQYFPDFEFLGYRILDGEMVDGFHICEQEICRYIKGYAQFYEKNEAMLSYMLETRQEDAAPETVDSVKYDAVKQKQEHRRAVFSQQKAKREEKTRGEITKSQMRGFQTAAASIFVLLCVLGLAMNSSVMEGEGFSLKKLKEEFAEKKLPESTAVAGTDILAETLETQNRLSEAVRMENVQDSKKDSDSFVPGSDSGKEEKEAEDKKRKENAGADKMPVREENGKEKTESGEQDKPNQNPAENQDKPNQNQAKEQDNLKLNSEATGEDGSKAAENTGTNRQTTPAEGENAAEELPGGNGSLPENRENTNEDKTQKQEIDRKSDGKKSETYVVCKGDTLTGISLREYGNENYVNQICKLNDIKNPDQIKIGQKILLP